MSILPHRTFCSVRSTHPHLALLTACAALLSACGTTAAPDAPTALAPVKAQLLLPEEPICDATSLDCPPTGGGGSSYSYWNLAQVATISPRAAYVVNVSLSSAAAYSQERNQHYPNQKNLALAFMQNPTPTTASNLQILVTPHAGLNWSEDGCSSPWYADIATLGFTALYSETFAPACRLHDFAYRNVGRVANEAQVASGQTALVNHDALRREVDDQFLRNMLSICAAKTWLVRGTCNTWANTFASAVHNHGRSSWAIWNFTWEE
ncbi:phospholipase (plasmid) [Deinococcus taeanensis]|uniref:phospholipase A2 n=1 Tax=Deinococcus taeanensis TaxID=2737050 RepID=UPI001CDCABBF|nr:phospholipase A2 [Deinococcus taeanensis]UBV44349.1 phospholipase [Deinococcus taeanensis]